MMPHVLLSRMLFALIWAVPGAAYLSVDPREPLVAPKWLAPPRLDYLFAVALLVVCWALALAGLGSRGHRVVGPGTAESKIIRRSGIVGLVCIAMMSFAFEIRFSRGFILLALPAGVIGLMLSRPLFRELLRLHRQQGHFCSRALMVGSLIPAAHIVADLRGHPEAGYHVVGALVTTGGDRLSSLSNIAVRSDVDQLPEAVAACHADTLIVTDDHDPERAELPELSGSLELGRQHQVMAPSLTDIAGPRIQTRPVAGLPLVSLKVSDMAIGENYV